MTKQQIFDKVAKHLLKQGKRSKNEEGDCRYRSPDGTRCAVGCLIPTNLYHGKLEGVSAEALPNALLRQMGVHLNKLLLSRLQSVHDDIEPEYWRDSLGNVAKDFRLSTKVLR
jgi:hypothetical protein